MKNDRPLSPHLTIYKPQITSASSIIGRICGGISAVVFFSFVWIFIHSTYSLHNDFNLLELTIFSDTTAVKYLSRIGFFGFLFAAIMYILTVIRHLFWDIGLGLDLKTAKISGYLCFAMAFLLSIFISCFTFRLF